MRDLEPAGLDDILSLACEEIARLAAERDDGHEADPTPGIGVLRREGFLAGPMRLEGDAYSYDWPAHRSLPVLVALGRADLSIGRLYEGHVNALQLIALYGTGEQKTQVGERVRNGALLAVWGADGPTPFTAEQRPGETHLHLHGAKRYASGMGLADLALVPTSDTNGRLQLLLLDLADTADRTDESSWHMRGMRASRSGTFDFEGMEVDPGQAFLGEPDDYRREPYFVGGIWRCAAVQLGAIEGIVATMVGELKRSGRSEHPLQSARIGEALLAARDARLQIEAAASAVEGGREGGLATSLAAFARLRVERAGLDVIQLAERGIGLAAFDERHPLARPIRDLSTYLRQANPDAVLLEHARKLSDRLEEIFR